MGLLDAKLPEGRHWLRVGDAYEVTKKPHGLDMSSLLTVPFAPMASIPYGGAYTPEYILKTPNEIRGGTYFERGDILVAKITPSFENGKQALATELPTPFGFATTEIIPLRPHKEEHDRRLLFFYLLHPDIRHHIAERMEGTTARQRVPADALLTLPFPKFSREEETAIADSLEMIQERMAVEARLIQVAKALKRTAMQTLFSRGLKGEPQKETEIGPVPKSWGLSALGILCESTDSVDLRSEAERIINYVDVSSISRNYLRIEATSPYVLKEAPGRARKRILTDDVILATVRPTLLRVAVVPKELDNQVCSTAFCVLRRDSKMSTRNFIYYVVQRDQFVQQLTEIQTGASYPAVTDRMVKEQVIPIPSLEEQREIVAILDAIDQKIDLHRRKHAGLNELFKALLHKLMTGKIRVAELQLSAIERGIA